MNRKPCLRSGFRLSSWILCGCEAKSHRNRRSNLPTGGSDQQTVSGRPCGSDGVGAAPGCVRAVSGEQHERRLDERQWQALACSGHRSGAASCQPLGLRLCHTPPGYMHMDRNTGIGESLPGNQRVLVIFINRPHWKRLSFLQQLFWTSSVATSTQRKKC